MSAWDAGYVSEIDYMFGYYRELNPVQMRLAMLNHGLVIPKIENACELGFGQGISANLHAAASGAAWWGTDFLPSQAAFAQELAQVSGARAHFVDDAFDQFVNRPDLPDFDYIGLHGIWSWVSDANRAVIVDFVRRKLRPGGVLFMGYNALPGWTGVLPLRRLMDRHARVMSPQGAGMVSRVEGALAFINQLASSQPRYVQQNPVIAEWLKRIQGHARPYLAHEYFNKDWAPMAFSDVAAWLEPAKLQFGCSLNHFDHVEALGMTDAQIGFLRSIKDRVMREDVRDLMLGQSFRRDLWVKGPRLMPKLDRELALKSHQILLTVPREDAKLSIAAYTNQISLDPVVYPPILDLLSDHMPHRLGDIAQALAPRGISLPQVVEAAIVMAGVGYVEGAQEAHAASAAKTPCHRINAHLIKTAQARGDLPFLANPATGGGSVVDRFEQIFLGEWIQGNRDPRQQAAAAWAVLKSQQERVMKDGKLLESDQDNQAELISRAQAFQGRKLPFLRACGVIPA